MINTMGLGNINGFILATIINNQPFNLIKTFHFSWQSIQAYG